MSLLDNLVGYWTLDEASGVRADSAGTNGLDDGGTATSAAGKVGTAAGLGGSPAYLFHASDSALQAGDVDFAIQAWVYLDNKTGTQNLVAKRTGVGGLEYFLRYLSSADRFDFAVSPDGGVPATGVSADTFGSPSTATWYHVVAWHDSVNDMIGIAVDAGPADTAAHATGVYAGNAAFAVGATAIPDEFLTGRIDEVGLWKGRILTSAERTSLYNGGAGLAYSGFATAGGGDTTPPTLSSRAVPSGGTTLTATLSESGCVPTSGTGGFTLGGTTATVASWAISGMTLTLTLSGTVYSGQTVTLTYARASTTDDIADAAGNFLADFSSAAVTNSSTQVPPLAAGTASFSSSGTAGIAIGATDATGGTTPYTYQWRRNSGGGSYSDLTNGSGVSGATTLTLTDGSAVAGTLYGYKLLYTDAAGTPATATSNAVTAQVYSGGPLVGGGGSLVNGGLIS